MIEIYNKRKENTNLKIFRLNAGLSQTELAEISDSVIGKITPNFPHNFTFIFCR